MFLDKLLQKRRYRWFLEGFEKFKILDIGSGDSSFLKDMDICRIDKEGTINNKLNFENVSFDIITMFAVVEHISDKDMWKLQKEIARVLRKSGILIITTPSKFSHPLLKLLVFLKLIKKKDIDEHICYYNKDKLIDVFDCFDLVKYKRFDIFNQVFYLCKKHYSPYW